MFVSKDDAEVLGRGTVVIVDAEAQDVRTLKSGMRFRYAKVAGMRGPSRTDSERR